MCFISEMVFLMTFVPIKCSDGRNFSVQRIYIEYTNHDIEIIISYVVLVVYIWSKSVITSFI